MTVSSAEDGAPARPAGPHTQRHAAVVLAATRVLVEVHEGTLHGLREVEVLLKGSTPRAITHAITRETHALKAARAVVVDLQQLVDRGQRLKDGPRLSDRPTVADLRATSSTRVSTSHLTAIRRWNLRERHRLRQATTAPATRLVTLLRGDGLEITAASVAAVWGVTESAGSGA